MWGTEPHKSSAVLWSALGDSVLLPIVLLQHPKHLVALGNVGAHAFGA